MQNQRYLGPAGITLVIAFITALMPTSIDLYLPALPSMSKQFSTSATAVNLTIILYFVFLAASMLVWGPLSDKYGRKPILTFGLVLFTISSLACAGASSIYQLILFRVVQSIGAGSAVGVNNAILKDIFTGRELERALATVITLILIAPVVSPTIGAFLLNFLSWRGIFWIMFVLGTLAVSFSLLLGETINQRSNKSLTATLGRMFFVLKNPRLTFLLLIFSSPMMPAMAFVISSSYIFITGFETSEVKYGLYYMIIASFRIVGPYLYLFFSRHIARRHIITGCFVANFLGGIFIGVFGFLGPVWFTLAVIPIIPTGPMIRPPGVNLMLEQQVQDAGTVSSLVNAAPFVFGGLGMLVISLGLGKPFMVLSAMCLFIGATTTILWLANCNKQFIASVLVSNNSSK